MAFKEEMYNNFVCDFSNNLRQKIQGTEISKLVFLCIGTGIGGAVFMDGKFLRPKRNSGFEFGHMMIGKDDECRCKCGNIGCFEVYCSKMKFKSQVQKILGIEGYVSAKELTERIMANIHNDEIRVLLEDYIKNLLNA